MYENEVKIERALLAAVDLGEYDAEQSLDELAELTRAAGAEVAGRVTQKRPSEDKATCVGKGRLEEMAQFCSANDVDLCIFDCELTASQLRNIEDVLEVRVIDRTTLILDIFARRAVSGEGKLQVELAQQKYRLPRLAGLGTSLSRLGGGIGTRGPGETKLESDRRHIRRRISALEEQLRELEKHRGDLRKRRKKNDVLTAAIVGYTNVGKSTLLNALTGAEVLAQDMLFATLDPTARAIKLPDGRTVVMVDTVGLIRRLPHQLVEAFKSTLEEAANADIILNVCDITSPDCDEQLEVTRALLSEIGAADIPALTVYNKCDCADILGGAKEDAVYISAKARQNFDGLLEAMQNRLSETTKHLTLTLPYPKAGLAAKIRDEGRLLEERYVENGLFVDCIVDVRTKLYRDLEEIAEQGE